MGNENKPVLSIQTFKVNKTDKDAFVKKCEEKQVYPSVVLRKLQTAWLNGEIKLEI